MHHGDRDSNNEKHLITIADIFQHEFVSGTLWRILYYPIYYSPQLYQIGPIVIYI